MSGESAKTRSARLPGRHRLATALALVAAAAGPLAAGCGSDDDGGGGVESFPPAAEPASSPAPETEPAGNVIEPGFGDLEGIVADPDTGLVAAGSRNPDGIVIVSGADTQRANSRLVQTPESPRHMQLAAAGGPVIFGAERSNDLVEVPLPRGEISTVGVGEFPHDATEAPNGRTFVANERGNTISVISDGEVVETLEAPVQPGGIAVAGDLVGVVAVAERVLRVYDSETLEVVGQVDIGIGATHVVADDERFYVADTEGDAILVIEVDPEPQIVDRANVPGKPYGIAIDNRNDRLWVTQTALNQVVELELTDRAPKELRSFPTIQQANTVAVDPVRNLVYLAGRANGDLQAIDLAEDEG